jgi:ornithine cyclodeaminase
MVFVALSGADVERLLPMQACIEVMAETLQALDRGEMVQPLRMSFRPAEAPGVMSWMPARRGGEQPVFGMKVLCVIPGNPARGLHAHQGAVLLLNGETGELEGMLDASTVTAIRTAAVSAVATRALAREDASDLAIIGTGVQAERHLEALPLVRPIRRARIAGRSPERARAFVERLAGQVAFPLEVADSAEAAVAGADIVVTATSASEPVLKGAWLAEGAHVNAVGASQPVRRELDTATVARASLFTDRRESLEREAGEYQLALKEGVIGPDHLKGEVGEVLNGKAAGRTSPTEITLFRSLGLASEDVATAQFVLAEAARTGAGTRVPW